MPRGGMNNCFLYGSSRAALRLIVNLPIPCYDKEIYPFKRSVCLSEQRQCLVLIAGFRQRSKSKAFYLDDLRSLVPHNGRSLVFHFLDI
jgi:hypothetical protein